MSAVRTRDLTTGSPMKLVVSFILPMLFGLLFQQLYSMVDSAVVGKYLGVDALAGVGSTSSINYLVLGLCNGICAGFAIPVAQKFGQQDRTGLRRFVGNIIWLGAAIALIVTLLTALLCRRILIWMNTPSDAFSYAYDYIFVIFLGIPTTMLYNLLSGILRSLGDSRTPLCFLILSSLLNVALDLVFVLKLNMGVAGAGLATLLSQLVSGLLCLGYMYLRFPILRLSPEDLRPRRDYAARLLNMGLPMGLQCSITAIGSIVLQTAVNGLGPIAMAGMTAGSKCIILCSCPFDAIGTTISTFAGQNLGAGKPERIRQGVRDCALLGTVYSLGILAAMYFLGGKMVTLFLDTADAETVAAVVPMGRHYLLLSILFFIPLLYVNLLRFTIQGLGFSELAMLAGVFEMVARVGVALALVPALGYGAACLADPAAWILADAFLLPAYIHCMKKQGCRFGKSATPAQ